MEITKIYAKEFTAKMMAAKATKATGTKHIFVPSGEGFMVVSEQEYNTAIEAEKKAKAESELVDGRDSKEVILVKGDHKPVNTEGAKTNVVGRASSGAWLKQVTQYLEGWGVTKNTVCTHHEGTKIWIGNSINPKVFWMSKQDRVSKVLAFLKD